MSADARFRIEALTDDAEARRLRIRWGDGHESRFHYVWLRHACFYPANPGTDPEDEALRAPDDPERLALETMTLDDGVLAIDGPCTGCPLTLIRISTCVAIASVSKPFRGSAAW